MTTFKSTLCLAHDLELDISQLDKDEISQIKKLPLASVREMILDGEIATTESIAALLLAMTYIEGRKTI